MHQQQRSINKHQSRSYRDLRITNTEDELEMPNSHIEGEDGKREGMKQDQLLPTQNYKFMIGNVDELFLTRQNDQIEQEIFNMIDELQEDRQTSQEESIKKFEIMSKNLRMREVINHLIGLSRKQNRLFRQSCILSAKVAKRLKQKQIQVRELSRQLRESQQKMGKLSEGIIELKIKLQLYEEYGQRQEYEFKGWQEVEEIMNQTTTQTEIKSFRDIGCEARFVMKVEASTQVERRRLCYEKLGHFAFKYQESNIKKEVEPGVSIEIQTQAIMKLDGFSQTIIKQLKDVQIETQQFLAQKGVQLEPIEFKIHQLEGIIVEPELDSQVEVDLLFKSSFKSSYYTSTSFSFEHKQIQSQHMVNLDVQVQTVDHRLENSQKEWATHGVQTHRMLKEMRMTQNIREYVNNQKKEGRIQVGDQGLLVKIGQIQQKLQTAMTEQDEAVGHLVNFIGNEVSTHLISYFRYISSSVNEVDYDDEVIKELENKGLQNQVFKGITRLLKQHKYLKICLDKSLQTDRQQEEQNNQRISEIYHEEVISMVAYKQKKQPKKKQQCRIY